MKSVKNWIIAALAAALALSIVTGVAARSEDGVTVEVAIWQHTGDPQRHYISARLADGSWRPLGTVPLELDDGTSADGRWRYGTHTFAMPLVVTCASGIAVPEPAKHPELVADCEQLLELKDEFDPFTWLIPLEAQPRPAVLNWSADLPMTRWTGLTVGGSPKRVTGLDLSGKGLEYGRVRPGVGNLTGLTELRLNDNQFWGTLPSKLGKLTRLTDVALGENRFEGCAPTTLWTVPNNDLATLGLPDCGPPEDISHAEIGRWLPEGTYRYHGVVFDIPPPGLRILEEYYVLEGGWGSGLRIFLADEPDPDKPYWMGIDENSDAEVSRFSPEGLFDYVSESLWLADE